MIRPTLTFALLLSLTACESSPKPKQPDPAVPPSPTSKLDAAKLVETAERLRDREFGAPPALLPSTELDAAELSGCEARCAQERQWLTKVLFAGNPPVQAGALAAYDADTHTVAFDAAQTEPVARAAVLAELVRALDAVDAPAADSWDAYLASSALRRGAGVFVATLDRAQSRNASIDAARLAMRPEGIYDLEFTQNRFTDGFATREGFAFVAAMIRGGGWSNVELAYHERPTRTLEVVRPDRYLRGDRAGDWALPDELVTERTNSGYELIRDGRVGPALFAEWLAKHVPAAAARAVYVGFEADRYQLFTSAEHWVFDWVTLWATPSIAQQVVEALDAGLRQRDDGAKFAVLRQGTTVAVVGATKPDTDLTTPATALVGTLPVFPAPKPRGVEFVPTPIDRIAARPQVTSVPRTSWTDLATGLVIDLGTLGEQWQVLPTQEPNLPWFAKHESGAVLQYLVEPQPLFDPAFSSVEYERLVAERFAATVISDAPPAVARVDVPVVGALQIDAEGRIKDRTADEPVRLLAWQFANGPFVTTLSLQSTPDGFDARRAELQPLLASVRLQTNSAESDGVIEFSVEE